MGKELFDLVARIAREVLGDNLVGIVVFGSAVYMGRGRDVDLLIVVRNVSGPRHVIDLELEIRRRLLKALRRDLERTVLDIHIVTLDDLKTGAGFVAGLALGHRVVLDLGGLRDAIREALKRVAEEGPTLRNRYGLWDLGLFARIALKRSEECSQRREADEA